MGNCFASLRKKKDSYDFESILYPLTLERPTVYPGNGPKFGARYDSLPHAKEEGQTLARIYSLYLNHELESINEELSIDLNTALKSTRSRSKSQDTLICSLTCCQTQISNIFKSSSTYCDKHSNCRTCGEQVRQEKEFVVVSGNIYCKWHIKQYNTI
jgi:hypothetical protein